MQDQIDSLTAKVDGLFAAVGAICAVAGVPVMERPGRQLSGTSGWCFRCPAEMATPLGAVRVAPRC